MEPDVWSSAVAETLRAERAAARLSQQELARRAGMPRPTYRRYESGERAPNLAQLAQIAAALSMSLSEFAARVEGRALRRDR